MKKALAILVLIILIMLLINLYQSNKWNDISKATDSSGTSDVQLIARAINRRGKRRKL